MCVCFHQDVLSEDLEHYLEQIIDAHFDDAGDNDNIDNDGGAHVD